MYDCQEDRYTDFATAPQTTTPALRGTLTARVLGSNAKPRLTELAAYATERNLDIALQQGTLTIDDLTLTEALNINARFGNELVISCHLRCDPPAHFD
ncbi:hypothetical protein [Vogesella sp. LIG4]|uniref:hypothetical protein n=1 Tax=Vogesella sp. LIG4 TaxID=1192162 RepID=UPI00081FF3A4|nr:hypothetical protein [Vogesella sp. LIG4]SCK30551.1 hypothetical protein PSELUDRAFT_3800 [Vogesella sp. LIG4]